MDTSLNLRKLLDLIDILAYGILAYIGFQHPGIMIDSSISILAILLVIDLIYYSFEFITQVRPRKVILLQIRNNYNFDFIIKLIPIGFLIASIMINWKKYEIESSQGLVFSIITFIKGLLYLRLKKSIKLTPNKLLFNGLFENDLSLQEIKSANIDSEKANITLCLIDNKNRLIKLDEKYLYEEKEQIDSYISSINVE